MATIGYQDVDQASVKMKWREPYVTSGVNAKDTAMALGCYRGFWIEETAVPSQSIRLRTYSADGTGSGVVPDSFAVVRNTLDGYALAVREDSDVTISLAAMLVWPLAAQTDVWISISITYTENATTVARYNVSDTDPTIADPYCTVIGMIRIDAGANTIDFGTNATAFYTDRTEPSPTARETIGDYVSGDTLFGSMSGTDRWKLPTVDQKKAMDAANSPSATNPFATEDDTNRRYFAEPTIVNVTFGAASLYYELDSATYGSFYIGDGATGTAKEYFDIRLADSHEALQRINVAGSQEGSGDHVYIASIRNTSNAVLNPAVDADSEGFYSSNVRVYLNIVYNSSATTSMDIKYGRKRAYSDLDQAPAKALGNLMVDRYDHADNVLAPFERGVGWLPKGNGTTVSDWFGNLKRKGRGHHSPRYDEESIASRIYNRAYSEAQVYNVATQSTLTAVTWPRCFAYGIDEETDDRYILMSISTGGREQIQRSTIHPDGYFSGVAYIDPITTIHAAYGGSVSSIADWRIVSIASDGYYFYLRAIAQTTGGTTVNVLDCWQVGGVSPARRSGWGPVHIGEPATALTTSHTDSDYNAIHVIVANDNYVAVNEYWKDIKDGGSVSRGVALYSKSVGTLASTGYGNATSHSQVAAQIAGPMVSDGSNIYFTVISDGSDALRNRIGVGQCTISNPQNVQSGATFREADTNSFLVAGAAKNPTRSLVYDGANVWLHSRFFWGGMPVDPAASVINPASLWITFDMTQAYEFGPSVFDGKYLWFCLADVDGSLLCSDYYHLVRYNPASNKVSYDLFGDSTVGTISDVIGNKNRWVLQQLHDGGFINLSPNTLIPFGNIIYDGDTVYWSLGWDGTSGDGLILQKLTNVHSV